MPAQALGDRLRLRGTDTEAAQSVARHLDRQLTLTVDRLDLGAEAPQPRGLGVAVGAHDEVDAGVELEGPLHDQPRLVRVGGRHDDQPSAFDVGHLEDDGVRCVTEDRGHATGAQPIDLFALLGDDHVAEPPTLQGRADQLADPAVATDDRMQVQAVADLVVEPGQLSGATFHDPDQERVVPEPRLERGDDPEQERVERDGQERPGDDQLEPIVRQQAQGQADRPDDERELADLGEPGGHGQGDPRRVAGEGDDHELRGGLGQDDERQHGQHRQRVRDQVGRVEQHADRHEEQDGEGVTQRERVGRRLVAHVRLAHDDAGEERAEREGDTEHARCDEGDAQGDGQDGEREQLA